MSSVSADNILTCLELESKFGDIPVEVIRNDRGVIQALQILVTRAFQDRNYQKKDTQHSIDYLILAIVSRLLKPVTAGETPTESSESSELTASAELTGSSEPTESSSEAKCPECPPEIVDLINRKISEVRGETSEPEPPRKKLKLTAAERDCFSDSDIEIIESAGSGEEELYLP